MKEYLGNNNVLFVFRLIKDYIQSFFENSSGVSGISNPNLLRNWYFADPVNSSGELSFDYGFKGIDSWEFKGLSGEITDEGISLTTNKIDISGEVSMSQKIVGDIFKHQIVTLSAMIDGELYSVTSNKVSKYENFGDFTLMIDIPIESNECEFKIILNSNGTHIIKAAKLEYGDTQTLCIDDNGLYLIDVPNKNLEIIKCNGAAFANG